MIARLRAVAESSHVLADALDVTTEPWAVDPESMGYAREASQLLRNAALGMKAAARIIELKLAIDVSRRQTEELERGLDGEAA